MKSNTRETTGNESFYSICQSAHKGNFSWILQEVYNYIITARAHRLCCLLIISRKTTIRKPFLIAPLPGNAGSLAHCRVVTADFPHMNFLFEQISVRARSLQCKRNSSRVLLTKGWIDTTPYSYNKLSNSHKTTFLW